MYLRKHGVIKIKMAEVSVYSPENVAYVTKLCKRFLFEKYQLDISADTLEPMVSDAARDVGTIVDVSLEDANKMVIVKIKERMVSVQPSLPPRPELNEPNNEDDFFKKLQDLESHRTLPIQSNNIPLLQKQPITTVDIGSSGPLAAPAQVVYLPSSTAPLRIVKPVIVNGSDRMWEYFTKRSTLIWTGPIPSNVPSVRLVIIMLPTLCSSQTPAVIVNITGAAGNTMTTVCVRENTGLSSGWDGWRPCCDSLSQLKALACPWTIKLQDTYGIPLNMGDDGSTIKQATLLRNGNLKIIFDDVFVVNNNETLLVRMYKKNDVTYNVIHYDPYNNAAELACANTSDAQCLVGAKVCNLGRQATIVLSFTSE